MGVAEQHLAMLFAEYDLTDLQNVYVYVLTFAISERKKMSLCLHGYDPMLSYPTAPLPLSPQSGSVCEG